MAIMLGVDHEGSVRARFSAQEIFLKSLFRGMEASIFNQKNVEHNTRDPLYLTIDLNFEVLYNPLSIYGFLGSLRILLKKNKTARVS